MHGKWNEFTNILSIMFIKLMINLKQADGKYFVKTKFRRNLERQTTTSKCRIVSFLYMFQKTAKCRLMSVQIALQFIFASTKNSTEVNHKMQGSIFREKADK